MRHRRKRLARGRKKQAERAAYFRAKWGHLGDRLPTTSEIFADAYRTRCRTTTIVGMDGLPILAHPRPDGVEYRIRWDFSAWGSA